MKTSGQKAVETRGIRVAEQHHLLLPRSVLHDFTCVRARARASRLHAKIYLGAALLRLGVSGRLIFQGLSKQIGRGPGRGDRDDDGV